MPKTPESGGIPLPYSWPPFTRDVWDDRAESLLESLGRMGHELEGYIVVPAVNNVGDYIAPKQTDSSSAADSAMVGSAAGAGADGSEDGQPKKPAVKPTKPLITYEQRRKFITKSMDLHRHTVGGGRSGRRGRAEVVAFLRYTLDKLDEKQQEAMEEGDELDTEQMERDTKGRFVGKKEGDEESSSSSEEEVEEEEEEETAEEGEEEQQEEGEDDEDYEERPKKRNRPGRPLTKKTAPPSASSVSSASPKKEKTPQKIMSEQEFLEQHNDLCEVCNTPGELLCCATCNLVFHVECARPKIASMDEAPDDWKCAYCWAAGVMGGKKDGKGRRKAAQAVREMERAKLELKGKKGGRPLSKKTIEKEVEAAVEAAINSVDGKATLEEAAAAGCRKCKKELDTGEKTRKTHDDHCPRKWRSVGKPPGTEVFDLAVPVKEESKPKPVRAAWRSRSLSPPVSSRSLSPPKQRGSTQEPDATQATKTKGRARRPRSQPPPQTESIDVTGAIRPPLEVGAAAGCVKCQLELDTGEKTRKTHDDHCPRKFKGVGRTARWQLGSKTTPTVSRQAVKQEVVHEEEEKEVNVAKKEKAPRICQKEDCNKLKQYNCDGYCMRHYREVVLEGQEEDTEEEANEEEVMDEKVEEEASEEEEEEKEVNVERPSKICHLKGCTKLKQYNCDGYCMRHYRQVVLEGQRDDAEEEEEAREEEDIEEETQEEDEDEGGGDEVTDEAEKKEEEVADEFEEEEEEEVAEEENDEEGVAEEVDDDEEVAKDEEEVTAEVEDENEKIDEEKTEEEAEEDDEIEGEEEDEEGEQVEEEGKEEKTRICRQAECNKYKQYNCDGYCMRHYRQMVLGGGGEDKEEGKEEAGGTETTSDVAENEEVPNGAKSLSPAPASESSPVKVEKEEVMVKKQIHVAGKTKSAQPTSNFHAAPTLEEAAAAGCKKCRLEFETGEKTRKTHNDDCPRKWKSAGKPPPGIPAPTSGRKKRVQSPVRTSHSAEEDESAVAALVAVAAATAKSRRSDRASVSPKADESSSRARRERKKPTVYTPQEGVPDREWQPDSSSISPQKKAEKKTEKKDEAPLPPKPKRGRPSRADIAAREAYAAYVAKSNSPPQKERKKPGPKPKKDKEKKPPPKKTTPPKKGPVIKPDTEGVGVLNRLPGTLFDCSACLDINKIKLCCYCACRVCFNKFGKERTILCDKCDQEYHTFCVGLDKIPEGEWVCTACIDDEKKQKILAQRRKEREARKKIEDEKRALEEAKKAVMAAERKKKYSERKALENEKKRIASEQRRIASEKRRFKDADLRAHGIPVKRGPGRPRKDEQRLLASLAQHPQKRGRGRPRKDGKDPIPRKFMSKYEISADNLYYDEESELTAAQRSRSGRKIQRTIFHDEVDHPGLMKKARTDEYVGYEKSTGAGKGSGKSASGKKEGRRKPGARECMQLTKKFGVTPIDEHSFDVLMDYSKRGKVDHLIRMRERMDDHSRFLEAQLAGLEALVKEKGELNIVCPPDLDS